MNPNSSKNWQPSLLKGEKLRRWAHATAETLTTLKLLGPRTAETAVELAHEICEGAGQAIEMSPDKPLRACHEGCPGCCHAMISATPPEACAIAAWLKEHRPNEVDRILGRSEEIAETTRTMDKTEYAESMTWCPLLDSELSCSVYPVRPISCRSWNSLSLERCHDCYFANNVCDKIPLDEHAYLVGQGARAGFSAGIEAAGLDGNCYELNSVLVVALKTPDACEHWANGEKAFEDCRAV